MHGLIKSRGIKQVRKQSAFEQVRTQQLTGVRKNICAACKHPGDIYLGKILSNGKCNRCGCEVDNSTMICVQEITELKSQ